MAPLIPPLILGPGQTAVLSIALSFKATTKLMWAAGLAALKGSVRTIFVRLLWRTIDANYGTNSSSTRQFTAFCRTAPMPTSRCNAWAAKLPSALYSPLQRTAFASLDYMSVTTNVQFPAGETFETVTVRSSTTIWREATKRCTSAFPIRPMQSTFQFGHRRAGLGHPDHQPMFIPPCSSPARPTWIPQRAGRLCHYPRAAHRQSEYHRFSDGLYGAWRHGHAQRQLYFQLHRPDV